MAASSSGALPYRFNTDAYPVRERAAIAREVFGRQVFRLDVELARDRPFHFDVRLRDLPGLRTVSGFTTGAETPRTRELLSDGSDDVFLSLSYSGCLVVSQRRGHHALHAGAAHVGSCAEPMTFHHIDSDATGILVPRRALANIVPDLDDRYGTLIDPASPALHLLRRYIRALDEDASLDDPTLAHFAVTHIHDLVALALGTTREGAELAKGRGMRSARFREIKSDIVSSLTRPDLSVNLVAERHHMTPRTVQRLFESEGTTFTEFLLNRRLEKAHRILGDTRHSGLSIGAVAFECGFGDISHFNRAFRRRYGVTPGDIRRQASSGRG